jgi:hypothetical protein
MEETKDRCLVASINSKEYKIEKIRTVLVAFAVHLQQYCATYTVKFWIFFYKDVHCKNNKINELFF